MVRESSDSFLVARENAVRIAQEMLDRKIGICAGCRALTALSLDLVGEWAADRDFRVIGYLDSESDRFPLGSARKFWAEEPLEALDRERAEIELGAETEVLAACASIVDRFGRGLTSR